MPDLDKLDEPTSPAPEKKLKKRSEKPAGPSLAVKIPIDTLNEVAVIAAAVNDERFRKRYLNAIPADYFSGPNHALMWTALQDLYRRGLEYSVETVRTLVGEGFDPEVLDGYVRERAGVLVNPSHHVEQLRWDHARAACVPLVSGFLEALRDPTSPPDKVRGLAERLAKSFSGHGDLRYLRDVPAVVQAHRAELTARREGRALYPFGIEGLDKYGPNDYIEKNGERIELNGKTRMIPGLAPKMVTLVTGKKGGGKSTFVGRVALAQALAGRRVLWGAWENSAEMSLELLAAMSLGWSRSDFMTGNYSEEEQKIHEERMLFFEGTVRFFELPFGRQRGDKNERGINDRHLDLIHQYVSDSGCDVFIADLFRRALRETRIDDEEQALWRMQAITQETRTHSILINQLTKEGGRSDTPTGADSKGTGEWEAIADNYLLIHLPRLYSDRNDVMSIQVEKQRWGVFPQAIECDWDPEYGSIRNGRTVPYKTAGASGEVDDFLSEVAIGGRKGKRR